MKFPLLSIPLAAALCGPVAVPVCTAQSPTHSEQLTPVEVSSLIADVVKHQLDDFHHTAWALRYRVHRIDGKDDTLRDLVESADGNVARTLRQHGQSLNEEETAQEEARLRSITAGDAAKRRRSADSSAKYGIELIGAMPQAMLYTLAPGQPQLPQFAGTQQVVLDYKPNPQFRPATTSQEILPGIAGRMWIDAETHHLVRIEIHVTKNLNLMFGILARVYQGGTLTYEQQPVGGGHYGYRNIEIDVKLRELMVKVVPYHETLATSEMTYLPTPPTLKQAVSMLMDDKP